MAKACSLKPMTGWCLWVPATSEFVLRRRTRRRTRRMEADFLLLVTVARCGREHAFSDRAAAVSGVERYPYPASKLSAGWAHSDYIANGTRPALLVRPLIEAHPR
jgi:hypothetical protein